MALLSGTKRISRDGIGEIAPMSGLLTAPTMALGADAPTNGTPYTFQPVVTSIENGTQDYTIPYNFATDPSLGGMASTLQDYATREGSQPPPIDAAKYMQMVQGDLANRGLTLNQIDENALNGTQMKHPGTYSYLVDSSGKIAAAPQFMADTSVADGQAWLRLAASAALGGALSGSEGAAMGSAASPTATAAANGALTGAATGTGLGGLGAAGYEGLIAGGGLYAANAANTATDAGVNGGTGQIQSIPQGSPNVAPLESAPQVTAPELAQVSQVPQANAITAQQAASTAGAANAFKPSDNYGDGMTGSQTSAYDSTINATGSPTLADAMASLKGYAGDAGQWLKDNPALAKLLIGGASAAAASSGNKTGGGYTYNGPMPTITRGNWQAQATPQYRPVQQMGLLKTTQQPQGNSGLWRYGLLGG